MVYLAIICALIAALGIAIFYIYHMVDRALASSETILRLRQEVSDETFRSGDFEKVLKQLEHKQLQTEPSDWSSVVNPFQSRHGILPPPPPAVPTLLTTTTPPILPTTTPPALP